MVSEEINGGFVENNKFINKNNKFKSLIFLHNSFEVICCRGLDYRFQQKLL